MFLKKYGTIRARKVASLIFHMKVLLTTSGKISHACTTVAVLPWVSYCHAAVFKKSELTWLQHLYKEWALSFGLKTERQFLKKDGTIRARKIAKQ